MSHQPRLSLETLAEHPPTDTRVVGPAVDAAALSIGIVHFGIGAFHRAHQAVYTELAAEATGDTGWGILGVTGRSDSVVQQLAPQDCLYGVLQKGADDTELRLIASVRGAAWPGRDSELVVATLAAPTTHIATLTITEKGYLRGADGSIDLSAPAVQNDLDLVGSELAGGADERMSQTPIGLLVRGLARRFRQGGEPFTVVPCDNLVGNGEVTRALVTSLVRAVGGADAAARDRRDGLLGWLEASVSFPSTMVDRIAPATTDADRDEALALLGLRDEALVVAEPFRQWVIEDDFAGPRPAWEQAGAIITADVAPYEAVKLRTLNATHSLLAYLGALKGHRTIAEAVSDPALRDVARAVIDDDILPTLVAPEGIDLGEYRDSVLERFANPNLAHTTRQVAMDGSQKLPGRILGTALDRLEAGHTPNGQALAVAAWISYIAATLEPGGPTLDDPLAAVLQAAVGSADAVTGDPEALVDRVLALDAVFPAALRNSAVFRAAVVAQLPVVRSLTAR
ncbi:mannitol dehydrogenase family protein [Cryobacterium tepidiphilum]|uniref:Mannitol-1-phosphate 5-dehydrogenase n=1 Tax=Cryobacterium tepidiphilum TaxID=2486026 RepID=A0A3M8LB85_9MICO|nr:mannitol dehydrogenase family protein [Cryobacterium tepidiphilum]RNE62585.1 mannitol dehydrogenase family protein [Cryobacterium tepidiphilum]